MNMKVNIAGVEWKNPVTVHREPLVPGKNLRSLLILTSWSSDDKRGCQCPVGGKSDPEGCGDLWRHEERHRTSNPGIDLVL